MVLGLHSPVARVAAAAVVVLPVALPLAYLVCLNHFVSKNTTSSPGRRIQASIDASSTSLYQPPIEEPLSLPEDVRSGDAQWVVAYERVASHPIPSSRLRFPVNESQGHMSPPSQSTSQPSGLLTAYLRAAHIAFSWTPQAFLIRSLIGDTDIRRTFDTDWILGLSFKVGELVNGVYRVSHYGAGNEAETERSELMMEVPASYTGPSASGLLVATLEVVESPRGYETDPDVIFVNETWTWRREDDRKPLLLETPFGKWFHAILARWLVNKGLNAVLVA
ncbi:hypothetical protein PT974_04846 [Cladobotryum mycophilum]|uniref:Uncharacterized protein n=1 Tax=Cladobotryum mycophilum TaxID=491253 RepID=A0ABR0SQC4_9HYPO